MPLPGVKEEEWEAPLLTFTGNGSEAAGLVTCCDVGITPASPGARIPPSNAISSGTTRSRGYSVATCLGCLAIACWVLVVVMCCVGDVPMPGGMSPRVAGAADTDWPKTMIDGFDDMQIAVELSQRKAATAQAAAGAAGTQVSYLGVHLPKASHADVTMSPILQQLAHSWAHINKEVTKQGGEQLSSTSFEATHMDPAPQVTPEHTTEDQTAQAVLESDYSAIAHVVQTSAAGGDSQGITTAATGPLDMPRGAQATLDGNIAAATPAATPAAEAAATVPTEGAPAAAGATSAPDMAAGGSVGVPAQQPNQDQQQQADASSTDTLPTIQQDATALATAPAAQPQQQGQHQQEVQQADMQSDGELEGSLTHAALAMPGTRR